MLMLWLVGALAWGQPVPVPEGDVKPARKLFDASEYESLGELSKTYEELLGSAEADRDEKVAELRARLEALQADAGKTPGETDEGELSNPFAPPPSVTPVRMTEPPAERLLPRRTSDVRTVAVGDAVRPRPAELTQGSLTGTLSFEVPEPAPRPRTVLPAGSFVMGTVLTGVEAGPGVDIPMLVQFDYQTKGPNQRTIDLRGCFAILRVRGELATDRVVGKAVTLSCVRDNGEVIDTPIDGFLVGSDSTFGVVGKLIDRQGRVLAASAVSALVEGVSGAIARAQETTQIAQNPLGTQGQVATNVTGNQAAYAVGSGMAGAAQRITDWYVQYADQLVPAIAVGAGNEVWIVTLSSVEIPPLVVEEDE